MKTCCWILVPATISGPAIYCKRPTRFVIVTDDGGDRVRKYKDFCDEHEALMIDRIKEEDQ